MKKKGFTLIELLVVVAIIALLISILLPSLARARELSKRAVCAANVRGIGQSCKIYANDYSEAWPIAPSGISPQDANIAFIGDIGAHRLNGDVDHADPSIGMCFWILVRGGGTTAKQYYCPSSSDTSDSTANPMEYFDFEEDNMVSYGYQFPYGGRAIPNEGLDPGCAVVADKCKKVLRQATAWQNSTNFMGDWRPDDWKQVNSDNHTNGEGQNVLYADGHAEFQKKAACGLPMEIHPTDGPSDPPYEHEDLIYWDAWDDQLDSDGGGLGGNYMLSEVVTDQITWPATAEDSVITFERTVR